MTKKEIFNAIQYKFLTEKLGQLGIGDKTGDIYSIIKDTFTILPGINVLPDDLLIYIWNFIGDENDDIKLRCTLMSCCKRWKNMLLSQKNVYMNSRDIYDELIPNSLLERIYENTERLVLNLNFKPRCIKSVWILSFISKFEKLKELVLIAWFGVKENDIYRLTICKNLHNLQIIAGNNKMTIFYMDKQNKDSLYRIKIGYMNALDPSKSYPHLNVLHCDWTYNIDQFYWFRGELYVDLNTNSSYSLLKWSNLCHNIHLVDNCRNSNSIHEMKKNTSVISYTNNYYFSNECSRFDSQDIYDIFDLYPNCKILKITNWRRGADIPLKFIKHKNVDLISIHSKYTLKVFDDNIYDNENKVNKYQFQAENIIFQDDVDRKKFRVQKKIKDSKLKFLQIELII